jgi:hypothetical protein
MPMFDVQVQMNALRKIEADDADEAADKALSELDEIIAEKAYTADVVHTEEVTE